MASGRAGQGSVPGDSTNLCPVNTIVSAWISRGQGWPQDRAAPKEKPGGTNVEGNNGGEGTPGACQETVLVQRAHSFYVMAFVWGGWGTGLSVVIVMGKGINLAKPVLWLCLLFWRRTVPISCCCEEPSPSFIEWLSHQPTPWRPRLVKPCVCSHTARSVTDSGARAPTPSRAASPMVFTRV